MNNCISKFLKGTLGMLAFVFILFGFIGYTKPETAFAVESQSIIGVGSDSIDMSTVMEALDGKTIEDGDRIPINEDYVAVCEVTTAKPSRSAMSTMNTTNSYTGSCNIYIMHLGTYTIVAYINHNISVTYYDSGLVHINSGSLNAYNLVTYVSTSAYGYSITNTDGSYSYAGGVVELFDATISGYYYYGCVVSVTPGNNPSFSFTTL